MVAILRASSAVSALVRAGARVRARMCDHRHLALEGDETFETHRRVQKLRDGGDFVRLLLCLDLTENQTALDRVGGNPVDGRFALGLLEGAARRLTVDRHDSPGAPTKRAVCNHRSIDCQSLSKRMDIYNCALLFSMRII